MNSEILIYQNQEGNIKIDVQLNNETVWLTQEQMANLFGKAKSTINEHIQNIYEEGELNKEETLQKFGNSEFQQKAPYYYNLDIITSAGGLPQGLSHQEFFEGFSVPRNKEIMRIFKDLNLVEQLGSGIPRILATYGKDCFQFSDNFLRMTFPKEGAIPQDKYLTSNNLEDFTPQVIPQVERLIFAILGEMKREEIQKVLMLSDKRNYMDNYQIPAMDLELIEMTIPEKPNSSLQKYRLTAKGNELKKLMKMK